MTGVLSSKVKYFVVEFLNAVAGCFQAVCFGQLRSSLWSAEHYQ